MAKELARGIRCSQEVLACHAVEVRLLAEFGSIKHCKLTATP